MLPLVLERIGLIRTGIPARRRASSAVLMVFLSFCGACVTGLLAQFRVPLPFTPVPVTGQVLAVLVCGALLGGGYGMLSQVIYVAMGAMGIPWFAGGAAGIAILAGPTGGYFIGFVVAALFLGTCTERSATARTLDGQVRLMLVAVAIIYLFGTLQLMFGLRVTLTRALVLGVVPFVAVDVLKAVLAALFTSAILPRS